jgi:hypothetical protein
MASVRGSSDTKSRVSLLSIRVAIITWSWTVNLIFIPPVAFEDVSAGAAVDGGGTPVAGGVGVGADLQALMKRTARMSAII